jgi:hypothetical protein
VSITNQINIEELDREWIDLCLDAQELGLSKDDIRAFLRSIIPNSQNLQI